MFWRSFGFGCKPWILWKRWLWDGSRGALPRVRFLLPDRIVRDWLIGNSVPYRENYGTFFGEFFNRRNRVGTEEWIARYTMIGVSEDAS